MAIVSVTAFGIDAMKEKHANEARVSVFFLPPCQFNKNLLHLNEA